MRLIDADALEAEFAGRPPDWYSTGTILRSIDSAPTIDAVPVVRGKWGTDRFKMERMICSECGVVLEWSKINNFCPNCGADMREESDHE